MGSGNDRKVTAVCVIGPFRIAQRTNTLLLEKLAGPRRVRVYGVLYFVAAVPVWVPVPVTSAFTGSSVEHEAVIDHETLVEYLFEELHHLRMLGRHLQNELFAGIREVFRHQALRRVAAHDQLGTGSERTVVVHVVAPTRLQELHLL